MTANILTSPTHSVIIRVVTNFESWIRDRSWRSSLLWNQKERLQEVNCTFELLVHSVEVLDNGVQTNLRKRTRKNRRTGWPRCSHNRRIMTRSRNVTFLLALKVNNLTTVALPSVALIVVTSLPHDGPYGFNLVVELSLPQFFDFCKWNHCHRGNYCYC